MQNSPDPMRVDALPRSEEAEKALLGGLMRDNEAIGEILQSVSPEHFYSDAHQKIYRAILAIFDQGRPVDLVTLAEELRRLGFLEDIGSYPFLTVLWESTPVQAHTKHYARFVRDSAIKRNIIHTSNEILQDCFEQSMPSDELLGMAVGKMLELSEQGIKQSFSTLSEALSEAYDRIDARTQGQHSNSSVPTGFTALDAITSGFHNNELVIIAARPSVGKTAFVLNIIRHAILESRAGVLFSSLEQSKIEIAERLMCAHARVDSHKLRKGALSADEMNLLVQAGGELSQAPLFIDDSPTQSMLRIAANARRLKKQYNIRLVAIDYLQLIEPENRRDPRQEQVAQISRRLKALARELQIPVVSLAQVNRSSEDRQDHRPRMSDLRESGSIEQDADTVLMLHRPDRYESQEAEGLMEVLVAKQRNGPVGNIDLTYVKQYMRFENLVVGTPFDL
jgi:replicative DNA helicase